MGDISCSEWYGIDLCHSSSSDLLKNGAFYNANGN